MTAAIDVEAKTLRIERDFRAPIERVFEAFIDPTKLQQWWGPEGMTTPEVDMDVREGGRWRTTMVNAKGGRHTVEGAYQTIAPHSRLVFSWGWVENGVRGHETIVDITLTQIEGGTHFSMVQSLFETSEARDDHKGGWTSSLNCLDAYTCK
ncbi:MAG: SRPBCC domain-containing protein [Kordiimonas sp.]